MYILVLIEFLHVNTIGTCYMKKKKKMKHLTFGRMYMVIIIFLIA